MPEVSQPHPSKSEISDEKSSMITEHTPNQAKYSLGDVVYAENLNQNLPYLIGTILDLSSQVDEADLVRLRIYARWINLPFKAQEYIINKRRKLVNRQTEGETAEKIRSQFELSRELFYTYLEIDVSMSKLRGHCTILNPLPSTFHLFEGGLAEDQFCCCYIYDYHMKSFTYFQGSIRIGLNHQAELEMPNSEQVPLKFDRYEVESELIFAPCLCEDGDSTSIWLELRDQLIAYLCKSKESLKGRKSKRPNQRNLSVDEDNTSKTSSRTSNSKTFIANSSQSPENSGKTTASSSTNLKNNNSDKSADNVHLDQGYISKAVDINQEYYLTELYKYEFDVSRTMKSIRSECKNSERLKILLDPSLAPTKKIPSDILSPRSKSSETASTNGTGNGGNKKEHQGEKQCDETDYWPVVDTEFTLVDFNDVATKSQNRKYSVKQTDGIACIDQSLTYSKIASKCHVFQIFREKNSSNSRGSCSKLDSQPGSDSDEAENEDCKLLCSYCYIRYFKYSYLATPFSVLSHRFILFEAMAGCFSFLKTLLSDSSYATQVWFPGGSQILDSLSKYQASLSESSGKLDEDEDTDKEYGGGMQQKSEKSHSTRGRGRKRFMRQANSDEINYQHDRNDMENSRRLYNTRSFENRSAVKPSEKEGKSFVTENPGSDGETSETAGEISDSEEQPPRKKIRSAISSASSLNKIADSSEYADGAKNAHRSTESNRVLRYNNISPTQHATPNRNSSLNFSHNRHDSKSTESHPRESSYTNRSRAYENMDRRNHIYYSPVPEEGYEYYQSYNNHHQMPLVPADEQEVRQTGGRHSIITPYSQCRSMSSNSPYMIQMNQYHRAPQGFSHHGSRGRFYASSEYYNPSEHTNGDIEYSYPPPLNHFPDTRYHQMNKRVNYDMNYHHRPESMTRKDYTGDSKHSRQIDPYPANSVQTGKMRPFSPISHDLYPDCDLCKEFYFLYQSITSGNRQTYDKYTQNGPPPPKEEGLEQTNKPMVPLETHARLSSGIAGSRSPPTEVNSSSFRGSEHPSRHSQQYKTMFKHHSSNPNTSLIYGSASQQQTTTSKNSRYELAASGGPMSPMNAPNMALRSNPPRHVTEERSTTLSVNAPNAMNVPGGGDKLTASFTKVQ